MPQIAVLTKNGIVCESNGVKVNLDPKITQSAGLNFVSHAHTDHLPHRNGGTVLSSKETSSIASLRGFNLGDNVEEIENFSLFDSGHILGARSLLFDDIFYTGDICTRPRGFLKGAKVPKCKILITECTFGLPEFIFPKISDIVKRVNGIIAELYSKGHPVILLGYELGKAQTLSQIFEHWGPLYYHDSVKRMNDLHIHLGVNLKDRMGHSKAESLGLLEKKPWLMVAPFMNNKTPFLKKMKSKYGAITIGFSGWAQTSKFSFGRTADYSIPLSDHCDFQELIELVRKSEAEQIFTVHGFVDDFASILVKMGFNARPLRGSSLDRFL